MGMTVILSLQFCRPTTISNMVEDDIVITSASINPPGQPEITGSHQYNLGDTVKMICRSIGGNPLSTLNWLRDDNVITNVAPTFPILTGPTNLISGSTGIWTCSSLNGYPAPTISIRIQDRHYTNDLIILQSYNVIDRSYTVTGTLDVVPLSNNSGQNLCCDASHLINNKSTPISKSQNRNRDRRNLFTQNHEISETKRADIQNLLFTNIDVSQDNLEEDHKEEHVLDNEEDIEEVTEEDHVVDHEKDHMEDIEEEHKVFQSALDKLSDEGKRERF
ncbi:unnamed protein product [Mytilus edulis]|uniref:Ig-like domain-containing protein n=1 Tax=Mytilus edulis TaxID=6550 RepID=A0A8S3UKU3_MYTED|nr:unnamed protein product [Mytilus edulis]